MKILFIGDIVGRPGREMVAEHLQTLKRRYGIDFAIGNYENASHGFGLTAKNAHELFSYGFDALTGGNHTWDKKEIVPLLTSHAILRPLNYPSEVPGRGVEVFEVGGETLGVINVMGHYGMPMCENPFKTTLAAVETLKEKGVENIFIDFHAETTAEKRGMMMLLQGRVSAIAGTHTHVGSDDLQIVYDTAYVSDVGLTGCRDNVIGMDQKAPLEQFMTGIKSRFEIPKKCKKILQCIIVDVEKGKCKQAEKIKLYDNGRSIVTPAFYEAE